MGTVPLNTPLTDWMRGIAELQAELDLRLPPSRARSLAQTKLDEARFWAMEAEFDHLEMEVEG